MTALPTPAEVAREIDPCHECSPRIAAAIRADRLRVIDAVEERWRNAPRGHGVVGTLRDLRRESEGGS